MARFTYAVNIQQTLANGDIVFGNRKRLGSDSNTDDVVLSFNATTVKSRSALRKIVLELLSTAEAGNELTVS